MKGRLVIALTIGLALLPVLAQTASAERVTAEIAVEGSPFPIASDPASNRIFVADPEGGQLMVIEGAVNRMIPLPAGVLPASLVANPSNGKVYVGDGAANRVLVMTPDRGLVEIGLDGSPVAMAINGTDNRVLVLTRGANGRGFVTIIDGETQGILAAVAAGREPFAIVFNSTTGESFVTNRADDTVTVIRDQAVVATIPMGAGFSPAGIAINTHTNRVFVGAGEAGRLAVIDGGSHSVVAGIDLPGRASSIVVNPITNSVFVACRFADSLSIIDGETNTHRASIEVGVEPVGISFNSRTNQIYVVNRGSNSVSVIDGDRDSLRETVNVGNSPFGVSVNPITNKIYVANQVGRSVTIVDGATHETMTVNSGILPKRFSFDPFANRMYLANRGSNEILEINGLTNETRGIALGAGQGVVAINPVTGRLYVTTNDGTNRLLVVDTRDENRLSEIYVGVDPVDVAVNPLTNRIFVVNRGDGTVSVIDGETNEVRSVQVGSAPEAIAINPIWGQAWVIHSDSPDVFVIDEVGLSARPIYAGAGQTGIDIDRSENRIFVSRSTGHLTVIDGFFSTGSEVELPAGADDVAFNPVTGKVYAVSGTSNRVMEIDLDRARFSSGDAGSSASTQGRRRGAPRPDGIRQILVGSMPSAMAVDSISNRIWVVNRGDNTVLSIDGATGSVGATFDAGTNPAGIAVNRLEGKTYVANADSGDVTIIEENATSKRNPLRIDVDPMMNPMEMNLAPSFAIRPAASTTENGLAIERVWYQVDTIHGEWREGYRTESGWQIDLAHLEPGIHILFTFPSDGDFVPGANLGGQDGSDSSTIPGDLSTEVFLAACDGATELAFTEQPLDATVCVGDTHTFDVKVESSETDASNRIYRWGWRFPDDPGFTPLGATCGGADSSFSCTNGNQRTLAITVLNKDADGIEFGVRAWDSCTDPNSPPTGGIDSDVATLTVVHEPDVINDLQDQEACEGGTAAFTAKFQSNNPDPNEPLDFTWWFDPAGANTKVDDGDVAPGGGAVTVVNTDLGGGLWTSVLTITGVQQADQNEWKVIAENACGQERSSTAELDVIEPPAGLQIDITYGSNPRCKGEDVRFSISLDIGETSTADIVNWYRDGNLVQSLPSSWDGGDNLWVYDLDPNDAGTYTAELVSICGSTLVSGGIDFVVDCPTLSIALVDPPPFCVSPFNDANADPNDPNQVVIYVEVTRTDPGDLSYWQFNLEVNGDANHYDGSGPSIIARVALDSDGWVWIDHLDSPCNFNYSSDPNDPTFIGLFVEVNDNTPVVDPNSPTPDTTCEGGNASFTVIATDADVGDTLTYAWYDATYAGYLSDGPHPNDPNTIISGATTDTLQLTNVGLTLSGRNFQAMVTDGCDHETALTPLINGLLTVNPVPDLSLTVDPNDPNTATVASICLGESVDLDLDFLASGTPNYTVTWDITGPGTIPTLGTIFADNDTVTVTPDAAGTWTYTVTQLADSWCVRNSGFTSNSVTVIVNEPPTATVELLDAQVCPNADFTIRITRTDGGDTSNWSADIYWGVGGPINVPGTGASVDYVYGGGFGDDNYIALGTVTNVATGCMTAYDPNDPNGPRVVIDVNDGPLVTLDPVSDTTCEFGIASFTGDANDPQADPLTFLWYSSDPGDPNTPLPLVDGAPHPLDPNSVIDISDDTKQLLIHNTGYVLNGFNFWFEVSDGCTTSDPSALATLTVGEAPNIDGFEANGYDPESICLGESANLHFYLYDDNSPNFTVQWEVTGPGGPDAGAAAALPTAFSSWDPNEITVTPDAAGTWTYSITMITNESGCVRTTGFWDNSATIVVKGLPTATLTTQIPDPQCALDDITVRVTRTDGGSTADWDVEIRSQADPNTPVIQASNLSNAAEDLAATAPAGPETWFIYSITYRDPNDPGSGPACTTLFDPNDVTLDLNINAAPVITVHPQNASACEGSSASFGVTANDPEGDPNSPTYQWFYSPDSGANWFALADGPHDGGNPDATVAGATTDFLTVGHVGTNPAMNGYRYRVEVYDNCATNVTTSEMATLTVTEDTELPVVTARPDLLVLTGFCTGGPSGITPDESALLTAWLDPNDPNAATATDNCDTMLTQLTPAIEGVPVTGATFFPSGPTVVDFRFQDNGVNTGTATATVFVQIYGDLNLDGVVNSLDQVILKNHLVENIDLNTMPFGADPKGADLNDDSVIDSLDAVILANFLVENIDCLPLVP